MFKNINLQDALERERELIHEKGALKVIYDAFDILNEEVYREREIRKRVFSAEVDGVIPRFFLNEERIFGLEEIRSICVKYRLRFLHASKFRNEIPYEAIQSIKSLENQTKSKLKSFHIVAPSEAFELEDCDKDPMLFLAIGNDQFYLIHQWGNDMNWHRKLLHFPLRSFATLGLTIVGVSLAISLLMPTAIIEHPIMSKPLFARSAFFIWGFISISSVVTYIGLTFFKNVSNKQWNSPFFKQHF